MEDKCDWHGSAPNAEQYEQAMAELTQALAELEAVVLSIGEPKFRAKQIFQCQNKLRSAECDRYGDMFFR